MRCGELQLSQRGSGKERRSAGTKRGSEKVCSLAWTVLAGGDHGPREGKVRTAHAPGQRRGRCSAAAPRALHPLPAAGAPPGRSAGSGLGTGGGGGSRRAPDWSCSAAFVLPLSHLQARARRCSARGRPGVRGGCAAWGAPPGPPSRRNPVRPPKKTSPNARGGSGVPAGRWSLRSSAPALPRTAPGGRGRTGRRAPELRTAQSCRR